MILTFYNPFPPAMLKEYFLINKEDSEQKNKIYFIADYLELNSNCLRNPHNYERHTVLLSLREQGNFEIS